MIAGQGVSPPRVRRAWGPGVVALLLAGFTFLFRFNALGGRFGGFDNDHFVYFVLTRQVGLGERPLRDFADAGLQGAWPSLTYWLPALAHQWFGGTLLTEAIFCLSLLALSVALAFLVTARLTSPPIAGVVTVLGLFLGTKLYNYRKVLVFSVATLLMMLYAQRATTPRAAALGAWAAIAFLFRHDYLVYLAVAVTILVVGANGMVGWRRSLRHLAVCGGTAALLLVVPLLWVQRHAGLANYFATNLEMSRTESDRTSLRPPRVAGLGGGLRVWLEDEQNGIAVLYYTVWAIPWLALAFVPWAVPPAGFGTRSFRALLIALAVLALLLDRFFLRGNVSARFGDLGAPLVVLAAWLLAGRRGERPRSAALRYAVATVAVLLVANSIWVVNSVAHELDTSGISDSVGKVRRRFGETVADLGRLPPSVPGRIAAGDAAADYLRSCTQRSDRVLVVGSAPEIVAFANRPFAGGQARFVPGFHTSAAEQSRTISRLEQQRVPIVLTESAELYEEDFVTQFPLVHEYLRRRFKPVGEVTGDRTWRVLVDRARVPLGLYGDSDLPCYR